MPLDQSLLDWIAEAMAPIGSITHLAMMGGATLYCEGTVFAIITAEGQLHFKADKLSDAIWDEAGCARFTYEFSGGKMGSMNYRLAPDDVHDDADALRHWAKLGLEAGLRAPVKKAKKAK